MGSFIIAFVLGVLFCLRITLAEDCQSTADPIHATGVREFQLSPDEDLWEAFLAKLCSDAEQREQAKLQARIQRNADGDISAVFLTNLHVTTRELNALVSHAPLMRTLDLSGVDLVTLNLSCLSELANLQKLGLGRLPAGEVDLDWLSPELALIRLSLFNATNVDMVLDRIAGMQSLAYIDLRWSDVTDDGIASLSGLPNLKILELSFAENITDGSVPHLLTLPNLEFLYVECSGISHAGAASISRANHGVDVYIHSSSP